MFMTSTPAKPTTGLFATHPILAAQAVDPDLASRTQPGSHTKLDWKCDDPTHPSWPAEVVQRVRLGSGCPYCSGRLPVAGLDDLATTHPALAAELVDPSQARLVGAGSGKKLIWRCLAGLDHEDWPTPVRNRAQKGTGCPQCAGRAPGSRSSTRQPLVVDEHPDLIPQAADPKQLEGLSIGSGVKVNWICDDCKPSHTYPMAVRKKVMGQRCPTAAGKVVTPGVNDLATTHPDLARQLTDASLASLVSRGSVPPREWTCPDGHVWSTPVYARVAGNGCPECSQAGTSKGEQELVEILRVLLPDVDVRQHVTGLLPGRQELDVVVDDLSLAFEFNGLLWHSEAFGKTPTYHRDKSRGAKAEGLDLVHVWEDQWAGRRTQVVRSIAHRVGATDRLDVALGASFDPRVSERLMARKLDVTDVDPSLARVFLNANHVQGPVTASRHLGLVDASGNVRALLSLRSPRGGTRQRRKAGEWEIVRYATLGVVAGGFTRLLAAAQRRLRAEGVALTRWVSFSDDAATHGGLYETAGFVVDGHHRPDYAYVGVRNRWTREPKEKYQRRRFREDASLVWDESWTEHQAARANGLFRIYDAGKTRWVKDV